ncbi:hypothetical protein VP01_7355g1, partial [Puccinia sorghi]
VQERVQLWLYNLNLIWWSRDGSSLLPDLKEICDAVWAEFDMMKIMEETSGTAPLAVQKLWGSHRAVNQEEVASLEEAEGPPVDWKTFVPGVRPPGQGGSAGICTNCGEKGHYLSQCAELTTDFNAQQVHIWQGDFYFSGSREKIGGSPHDVVWVANLEGPAQAKPEATSASGVVMGAEWGPTVVGAEVWVVQSNEQVMFGRLYQMEIDFTKESKGKEMVGRAGPTQEEGGRIGQARSWQGIPGCTQTQGAGKFLTNDGKATYLGHSGECWAEGRGESVIRPTQHTREGFGWTKRTRREEEGKDNSDLC